MTNPEFSIEFDILYNNISSNKAPGLNEYEKSVFLTKAQEQIVTELYSGRNTTYNSFEETEEQRRYLSNLVCTGSCGVLDDCPLKILADQINEYKWTSGDKEFLSWKVEALNNDLLLFKYIGTLPIEKVSIFLYRQTGKTIPCIYKNYDASILVFNLKDTQYKEHEEITLNIKYTDWLFPEKLSYAIHKDQEIKPSIGTLKYNKSFIFKLPENLMFVTYESATIVNKDIKEAIVYPVSQDELSKIINNPFRGPSKNRILRLDNNSNTAELISNEIIIDYTIRYIRKPNPIILTDLEDDLSINGISEESECELDSSLHRTILDRAVALALQTMYSK